MTTTNPIAQIWQLTKDIEQAMAVSEFETAARLTEERSPLVMGLAAPLTREAIETLKAVAEIDLRIMANAREEQVELTAEYTAAMQATRGLSQYERVAQL